MEESGKSEKVEHAPEESGAVVTAELADDASSDGADASAIDRSKGQWFVVNTLSGHENKVKNTIERHLDNTPEARDKIHEILIPMEQISEVKQGKKTTTARKFFPGYMLVRMDLYDPETKKMDDDAWYFIRQTQGVIGFVGRGDRPVPLPPHEVSDLLDQTEGAKEQVRPKIDFEVGETVRIKDGAFENFEGAIEEIDHERGKLKILVAIFGRSTPVELEFWQVERGV